MINILILADSDISKKIHAYVNNYMIKSQYDNMAIVKRKGNEFMNNDLSPFDLLFIDERYQHYITGNPELYSSLVKQIENNNSLTIVVSNEQTIPVDLIKLNIRECINFDFMEYNIHRILDNYLLYSFAKFNMFHYKIYRSNQLINSKQILFFQSEGKRIIIQTKQGTEYFYGQLSSCREQMCIKNFVLIHQSYLVNPFHINAVKGRVVYIGNWVLPISRKYLESVRKIMFDRYND